MFLLIGLHAEAQSYEVPKDYHFKTQDDYSRYEPDVVKTADWMMQTAWTANLQKQDAASQFFLSWIKGSAAVTIRLTEAVMNLSDRNPQLGFTYMSQYSKYVLEHPNEFNQYKATLAALKAVITKYQMEPTRKKDLDVEKLVQLEKENKLADFVVNDFYTE